MPRGRVFRRGGSWWISHYHRGREVRESVAKLLNCRPNQCTEEDGTRLLALRQERREPGILPLPFPTASFSTTELRLREAVDRVTKKATIFAANELRAMFKPIVYAYFRFGQALYVGASRSGVARPCAPDHHRLGEMRRQFLDDDHLVIWAVESWDEARRLEREIIAALNPQLNGRRREPR